MHNIIEELKSILFTIIDNINFTILEFKCPYRFKKITKFEVKCSWCKNYGDNWNINCNLCGKQRKIKRLYKKKIWRNK